MRRTSWKERLVLTGMAALTAAMLGRMGWVNWCHVLLPALALSMLLLVFLVVLCLILGVAFLLVWVVTAVADGILRVTSGGGDPRRAG